MIQFLVVVAILLVGFLLGMALGWAVTVCLMGGR